MKQLVTLVAAVAALAAFALGSITSAQESLDVTLDSLEGFDITGSATLTRTAADYTDVEMTGAGLTSSETHINHIHEGTGCGEGEYGAVIASLTELVPGDGDTATATTMVLTTDAGDAISFEEIADGNHVLIIHEVDGTPAACGSIPAAAAEGEVMAAEEEEADEADGAGKAPAVGSGGFLNQDQSGIGFALVLAGALAVFGLSSLGAVFAVRRIRR